MDFKGVQLPGWVCFHPRMCFPVRPNPWTNSKVLISSRLNGPGKPAALTLQSVQLATIHIQNIALGTGQSGHPLVPLQKGDGSRTLLVWSQLRPSRFQSLQLCWMLPGLFCSQCPQNSPASGARGKRPCFPLLHGPAA